MTSAASRRASPVAQKVLPWVGVIAFGALAVACGRSDSETVNPVGPALAVEGMSATAADQAVARDVRGTLQGRFDFTHMWGPEWWQFYSDGDATGTVSHLGLSGLHTRHVPDLTTGALEQGEFTLTAANGDEIHGTYEGTASYDPDRADLVHGTATFVVSGGSGRFAGATGSITATFREILDDPSWASAKVTWRLAGTVSY